MKKINNLDDLRYRKLFLRSEIMLKEQRISKQFNELKSGLNSTDIKNEILKSAINNPATVFNIARLTYDLIIRYRKYQHKKNSRTKQKKS